MPNAYKRIKKENQGTQHVWDCPVPSEHPRRYLFIQIGIGVPIASLIAAGAMIKASLEKKQSSLQSDEFFEAGLIQNGNAEFFCLGEF